MRLLSLVLLTAVAFAAPMEELYAREASGSTVITARIPRVCDISADSFVVMQDGTLRGSVFEYCNTSTSFQIIATYRPLASGEAAQVRYGQELTSLGASGQSTVAVRFGQRLGRVPVEIDTKTLSEPLAVAFSVAAI